MSKPYSLSVKLQALTLYREGYGSTSISNLLDINSSTIRRWITKYHIFKHPLEKQSNVKSTPEFKEQVVGEVLKKSLSCRQVALKYRVSPSAVESWSRQVIAGGYESLSVVKFKRRPPKIMPRGRPKKQEPQTELEKLQVELERARTENALLKKVIALVEQRETQMHKVAKSGLKPSKN